MKKPFFKSLLLTVMALLTLISFVSCSTKENQKPRHDLSAADILAANDEFLAASDSNNTTEPLINRSGEKLSAIEQQDCDAVFDTINKYYGVRVGRPKVLKTSFSKYYNLNTEMASPSIMVTALYDAETSTIYLFDDLSEWNVSFLAHEYVHYISYKLSEREDGNVGFAYQLGGEEYQLGNNLNEGVCNYLSTQVYPHPAGTSVYEFETYCASLLSTVLSKNELANAFFTGNLDTLMDSFNTALEGVYENEYHNGIELRPFDRFNLVLQDYYMFLNMVNEDPSLFIPAVRVTVNCCAEMLYFYGKSAGEEVLTAMRTETNNLIANAHMIDWKKCSDIQSIMAA